ncbi:MAG: PhoX family phosphatase [Candidatus Competibacteraceae bacterium]|jgi:secreted PhoX family phosphatase|nr:PhoX family phosphatase [Candidatus Competibacteraceae bacterium]
MIKPDAPYSCRSEAYEASEDTPTNPCTEPTFGDVVNARLNRRAVLKGALTVTAALTTGSWAALLANRPAQAASDGTDESGAGFSFTEIAHGVDTTHHVAPGYKAEVLIRWGDPVTAGAAEFDPYQQTPEKQVAQFGYNNDFIGYIPLPLGSNNAEHGLLCINHEYTDEEVMFPGLGKYDDQHGDVTQTITEIEMACNGGSIIEVKKVAGKWQVVPDSGFARRITALDTEIAISGPAAGHDRLKTSADPSGTRVIGTVNNCAGGITPWGTYLMAEENFHGYFWGDLAKHPKDSAVTGETTDHPEKENYARYGVPENRYAWGKFHKRWNIHAEPNEPNRFGWIVEVDPLDPDSIPVKRTALGRFKHEGAENIINKDGRLVVYSGDDQRFEYLYKFVSEGRFDANNREANQDLLDKGTLTVAKFNADGTLNWLPLVFGQGGLTAENRFNSQADVLIETRRAASVLGATPMDRPEDVEPNPITNKVYVMLTNNSKRKPDQLDAVNDRAGNIWGQIVELTPPDGDHAAEVFRWDLLVKCGNPQDKAVGATWNTATSANGWLSCPDNGAVDHQGRLWVTTDQGSAWSKVSGTADGVWALETAGERRGTGKLFFRVPVGAEMCGPRFTPDDKTLFVAVQHPATDGTKAFKGFERGSTFEDPATRWPDFNDKMPPRPSVVVITKEDGGTIGS